jgi:hypothetical protein
LVWFAVVYFNKWKVARDGLKQKILIVQTFIKPAPKSPSLRNDVNQIGGVKMKTKLTMAWKTGYGEVIEVIEKLLLQKIYRTIFKNARRDF